VQAPEGLREGWWLGDGRAQAPEGLREGWWPGAGGRARIARSESPRAWTRTKGPHPSRDAGPSA